MYRRMMRTGVYCTLAVGLWMATPDAEAQRRGVWAGGRGGWNSPGISYGVDRGGFYTAPSYGRYGWDGYGWNNYGYGSGWNNRPWNSSWYGSTWPRSSFYYAPGYSGYSYPSSSYYYSAPAVTYTYPSTTYGSAPASTYFESSPSYGSSSVGASSASRDTARLRVHVPDPTAQVWVNDAPTQQRGMERDFETPPLSSDRTNTYEIRAKWQEDGRTMEQTRTVRVQPGAQEVIHFGQAE